MSERHIVTWRTYRINGGHRWVAMEYTTHAPLAQGWAKTKTEAQDAARKFSRSQKHENAPRLV